MRKAFHILWTIVLCFSLAGCQASNFVYFSSYKWESIQNYSGWIQAQNGDVALKVEAVYGKDEGLGNHPPALGSRTVERFRRYILITKSDLEIIAGDAFQRNRQMLSQDAATTVSIPIYRLPLSIQHQFPNDRQYSAAYGSPGGLPLKGGAFPHPSAWLDYPDAFPAKASVFPKQFHAPAARQTELPPHFEYPERVGYQDELIPIQIEERESMLNFSPLFHGETRRSRNYCWYPIFIPAIAIDTLALPINMLFPWQMMKMYRAPNRRHPTN